MNPLLTKTDFQPVTATHLDLRQIALPMSLTTGVCLLSDTGQLTVCPNNRMDASKLFALVQWGASFADTKRATQTPGFIMKERRIVSSGQALEESRHGRR